MTLSECETRNQDLLIENLGENDGHVLGADEVDLFAAAGGDEGELVGVAAEVVALEAGEEELEEVLLLQVAGEVLHLGVVPEELEGEKEAVFGFAVWWEIGKKCIRESAWQPERFVIFFLKHTFELKGSTV